MATKSEPRFDFDLLYGEEGESIVRGLLRSVFEVKRKRRPDRLFYVEFECDKGRTGHYADSGISVTHADSWAYVVADSEVCVLIPLGRLAAVVEHHRRTGRPIYEEKDGSCPTRGYLVSFEELVGGEK